MKRNTYRILRNAIIRGINESFNIDDMGNDITNTNNVTKSKVLKHSKAYASFIETLISYTDLKISIIDDRGRNIPIPLWNEDIASVKFVSIDSGLLDYPIVMSRDVRQQIDKIGLIEW